jgi:hypothetical protein
MTLSDWLLDPEYFPVFCMRRSGPAPNPGDHGRGD